MWRSLCVVVGAIALVLQSGLACSGDDDGGDPGPDQEGLRMCCEIGAICHEVGPPDPDKQGCHIVGHENDPAACRENYERCITLCMPTGEGGQAGAPMEHACE